MGTTLMARLHPKLWKRCRCTDPSEPHYEGTGPHYIIYDKPTRRYTMIDNAMCRVGDPMTTAEANAWAVAYKLNRPTEE